MGILPNQDKCLSPAEVVSFSARCLDQSRPAPNSDSEFESVLNGSKNAVMVQTELGLVKLQKALDLGVISIIGAGTNRVQIKNNTKKSIRISVNQPAVLGTPQDNSFDYPVTGLLRENVNQTDVWKSQRLFSNASQYPEIKDHTNFILHRYKLLKSEVANSTVFEKIERQTLTKMTELVSSSAQLSTSELRSPRILYTRLKRDAIREVKGGDINDTSLFRSKLGQKVPCAPIKDKLEKCYKKFLDSLPKSLQKPAKRYINDILDAIEEAKITDPRQIAYIFSTAQTESKFGGSMTELAPKGTSDIQKYFNKKYNERGGNKLNSNDGYTYRGRGFAHLTARDNYKKFGKKLGIDLLKNPDLASDPKIAAKIMVEGMRDGLFRRRKSKHGGARYKLSDFFNDSKEDFFNARHIINHPGNLKSKHKDPEKREKSIERAKRVKKMAKRAKRFRDIIKKCSEY